MNKAIFLPIIALGVMVFQKITNFQFSSQEVQIISDGALALAVFLGILSDPKKKKSE